MYRPQLYVIRAYEGEVSVDEVSAGKLQRKVRRGMRLSPGNIHVEKVEDEHQEENDPKGSPSCHQFIYGTQQ